jgi:enolase-phosphatase E1
LIRRVVTDIEGTTTSIAFVKDTLFPYARRALPAFVAEHAGRPELREALDAARREALDPALSDEDVVALLVRWIDQDRKVTPLKAIQGMIWREAYRRGVFVAHVYPDVSVALGRWRALGMRNFVFSSGSIEAQRLLFAFTTEGDLSHLFDGFFDTTTGTKIEPASYARIAAAIEARPEEVLFLSDAPRELDAAKSAGMLRVGLVREGADPPGDHPFARSFDDIVIDKDSVFVK